MLSSAWLFGAGFFVTLGCEVALSGAGGGGAGGGGKGSGLAGWGGVCCCGGEGGAGGGGGVGGASSGVGGGGGVGGVGVGGAGAAWGGGGGAGGGGGGGGGASIGCGFGGWSPAGPGRRRALWRARASVPASGACIEDCAVPANTIEIVSSCGGSGGRANGMPISSAARMMTCRTAETMAPRRSAGGMPSRPRPSRSSPCITRCSTVRQPSAGFRRGGAGWSRWCAAGGAADGAPGRSAGPDGARMASAPRFAPPAARPW